SGTSFLRERLVQGRDDRRALFQARTLVFFVHRRPRRRRLRILEGEAGGETPDLVRVEHFAREQLVGDLHEGRLLAGEQLRGALILIGDELLHFLVDLDRGVFAVVLVLGDLAAEEDLLFLLAEGERPHRVAHAPLADHLARELGRAFEIVAGAGRQAVHRDLFGDAAAEENRDLILQVGARVVVFLVGRELLREAERHAARDDRDLVNRIGV